MASFRLAKIKTWHVFRDFLTGWSELNGVRGVALATITVTTLVMGVRHLGRLQPLELQAYDQMVQWRGEIKPDPRLLIVGITEQDIRIQKRATQSDLVISQLLTKLQKYQPKVIGLDLYRDIPLEPGHQPLAIALQQPNIIAIRNIDAVNGTAAPPNLPSKKIGFNDILIDNDGAARRNLLFAKSEKVLYSFSLRLAIAYLQHYGISPEGSKINPKYLQLGKAVFVPLKEASGGYQNVDDGYQILLNYRSANNLARQVSLNQVLTNQIEPSWVKDKIVIIGTVASSAKDNFYTPFSPVLKQNHQMPGVLVHGQMVSQFLDAAYGDRPLFWFWSKQVEILWIGGWVLLGSILAWWIRHPLLLSLGITASLIILFGSCFYIFTQQGWIPLAAPTTGFIISNIVIVMYCSYEAKQQQQIVMKLLGQNTSPEVAKTLWKGRHYLLKSGKLPGQKLIATVLFSDIKDFSTIAERKTPESLLEWLNELLDIIAHEVTIRDGIINKFTGDGVMAVFGVPMSHHHQEDVAKDAFLAVDCATVLSDRLVKLNRNWESRGLPVIQMRIGIFTGPVVVGSLGGKDRLEYGVIGDTVNISSRLESCEKDRQPSDCRILIGDETLIHLQEKFLVESWGPLALKGKQQMVDVYRVIGRKIADGR